MSTENLELECPGAGKIFIGTNPHVRCGGRVGFSFGVTWGKHGAIGGVLPRGEAEKLLNMLYEQLKNITETEQDEYEKAGNEMRNFIEGLKSA